MQETGGGCERIGQVYLWIAVPYTIIRIKCVINKIIVQIQMLVM